MSNCGRRTPQTCWPKWDNIDDDSGGSRRSALRPFLSIRQAVNSRAEATKAEAHIVPRPASNMHTIVCNNLPRNTHFCSSGSARQTGFFTLDLFSHFGGFTAIIIVTMFAFPPKQHKHRSRRETHFFGFQTKSKRAQNYQFTANADAVRRRHMCVRKADER